MARFRSFGLTLDSSVPLGLQYAEPGGAGSVLIRFGDVPDPSVAERPEGDGCWSATETRALYFWPDVGAFAVEDGHTITMDPAVGADTDTLRLTLLGPLLATLLHQRGYLVLHASGLCGAMGAVAICAHSGTGKSTTAATLAKSGYALLTDDLLVIDVSDDVPVILPGGAGVKLWDASAEALGLDLAALDTIGERYSKRALSVRPLDTPKPLRAVYVLTKGTAQPPQEVSRPRAVIEVMSRSYCSELLRLTGTERNLDQVSALVRQVPVLHLERGETFEAFEDWAQALRSDVRNWIGDPG
jgi:hypothetical protein